MICLVVAAACLVASTFAAAAGEMVPLVLMEAEAKDPQLHAVCIDGTAGAYYLRRSKATNSTCWMLFLQGGGWCTNEEQCYLRSLTSLGSSTFYPSFVNNSDDVFGGVTSDNCTTNPAFCQCNLAYLQYCDGASYSGLRDKPLKYHSKTSNGTRLLHFRGRAILHAFLHNLLQNEKGFAGATEVVLGGSSAGALATIIHSYTVSRFVEAFIPSVKKLRAVVVSGFFLDQPNVIGMPIYQDQMKGIFEMANATDGVDPRCIAQNRKEPWRCMFAEVVLGLASPMPTLLLNSQYDQFEITCILDAMPATSYNTSIEVIEGNCSAVPGYGCLADPLNECASTADHGKKEIAQAIKFATEFQAAMKATSAFHQVGNGAFIDSCFKHGEAWRTEHYTTIAVGGTVMNAAVMKWWVSSGRDQAASHTYVDCMWSGAAPFGCNPTC